MARRLATLAAVMAMLLVGATARTTITTVEIDEAENQGRGGCRQQLQRQGELSHCRQFLQQQAHEGGGQYGPGGSQYGPGGGQYGPGGGQYGPGSTRRGFGSEHLDLCCNQLRQISDEQCRCEGLREIVRRQQQQQRGQYGFQEVEQMARTARNLPQMCGLGPQFCEIRAVFL